MAGVVARANGAGAANGGGAKAKPRRRGAGAAGLPAGKAAAEPSPRTVLLAAAADAAAEAAGNAPASPRGGPSPRTPQGGKSGRDILSKPQARSPWLAFAVGVWRTYVAANLYGAFELVFNKDQRDSFMEFLKLCVLGSRAPPPPPSSPPRPRAHASPAPRPSPPPRAPPRAPRRRPRSKSVEIGGGRVGFGGGGEIGNGLVGGLTKGPRLLVRVLLRRRRGRPGSWTTSPEVRAPTGRCTGTCSGS